MAGDPDVLFHFIQLSDFISILLLSKSREEREESKPLPCEGTFDFLNPLSLRLSYFKLRRNTQGSRAETSISIRPGVPQTSAEWPWREGEGKGEAQGRKDRVLASLGGNNGVE